MWGDLGRDWKGFGVQTGGGDALVSKETLQVGDIRKATMGLLR
jgi:hypothetical protein